MCKVDVRLYLDNKIWDCTVVVLLFHQVTAEQNLSVSAQCKQFISSATRNMYLMLYLTHRRCLEVVIVVGAIVFSFCKLQSLLQSFY